MKGSRQDPFTDVDQVVDEIRRRREEPVPTGWWWLSFCDPQRPEGQQFLGISIVEALSFVHAVMCARRLGCNPGGEVGGVPLYWIPGAAWRNRLLTREEAKACAGALEDMDGKPLS